MEVKISIPVLVILVFVFVVLLVGLVYFAMSSMNAKKNAVAPVLQDTATATLTVTVTPSLTPTGTQLPTWTPLPLLDYTVKKNETCSDIAAQFRVSVQSIILANNLDVNCTLSVGTLLRIPQPTPTASPVPTATPEALEDDPDTCKNTMPVIVDSGMTLSSIAFNYNVSIDAIRDFNHLSSDVVRQGQTIIVPLCDRLPTAGPTPTATPVPPYPAPNLLLPRSGEAFNGTVEAVTLQWSVVANLRENEVYRVVIQDLTSTEEKILVQYVKDSKFIIPGTFRSGDNSPHIYQWTVSVARQINQDRNNPIYEEAGHSSVFRVFSWIGTGTEPAKP